MQYLLANYSLGQMVIASNNGDLSFEHGWRVVACEPNVTKTHEYGVLTNMGFELIAEIEYPDQDSTHWMKSRSKHYNNSFDNATRGGF